MARLFAPRMRGREPDQIAPGIFLGCADNANRETCNRLQIDAVVNLAREVPNPHIPSTEYLRAGTPTH